MFRLLRGEPGFARRVGTAAHEETTVMAQFLLIGLCEPVSDDDRADFEEWFGPGAVGGA